MTTRWGFLGAGYVASRALAPAVHSANGAVLQAVASRDPIRSAALEPVRVHDTYGHLLDDVEVDAVYVNLTNVQHREWVVRALRSGKDVLCEKPLALDASEARLMLDVARECGRHLVEAAWVRWHPRFRRFATIVRCGQLGDDVTMRSAFTFQSDMTENYRLQPDWGGGALLDVGCYQAHAWIAIAGTNADVVVSDVDRRVGPTGVDLTTQARCTIAGPTSPTFVADMLCSFDMAPVQYLEASGETGTLSMGDGEAFTSWREVSSLRVDDHVETFPHTDAFVDMVTQVSRHFAGHEPALFDPDESVTVASVLDAVRAFSPSS